MVPNLLWPVRFRNQALNYSQRNKTNKIFYMKQMGIVLQNSLKLERLSNLNIKQRAKTWANIFYWTFQDITSLIISR